MAPRTPSFWNFNIFDFFMGVVSGLVALAVFYSLFPNFVLSKIPDVEGIVLLLAVLILSYVLGRLIQPTAQRIERAKVGLRTPFEDELAKSEENGVYGKFLIQSQDHFRFDIAADGEERKSDLESLFMLTRAYLTNNAVSPRVERFHASYLLFLNLSLIFFIGTIGHTIHLLVNRGGLSLIVFVGLMATATVLSYHQRLLYHRRMAKVMIYDFYADVVNPKLNSD